MNDGEPQNQPNDFEIDPARTAYFFDFDGTLASIVEDPGRVRVSAAVLDALDKLYRISGGALAIVSGRPVDALDRFLSPLRLPLSGVHGLEWRDARGRLHQGSYDSARLEKLGREMARFARSHAGLIVEEKPGSVALHYRRSPDLAEAVQQLASDLADRYPDAALMRGKMVVELRFGGRSKADAVSDFMAEEPFAGLVPLFVGDDVTDEDAFRFVERHDGIGIKIGEGETAASFGLPDRQAFETWLTGAALGGVPPQINREDKSYGRRRNHPRPAAGPRQVLPTQPFPEHEQ